MDKIDQNRFWWFQNNHYLPPIYADLRDDEFQLLVDWFEDTENRGAGECSVPMISFLVSFVGANNIGKMVQCGTSLGYSTLLLGWMFKKIGRKHALFTVDIHDSRTQYAMDWIAKAGLEEIVDLCTSDSANSKLVRMAFDYLRGSPQLIFIDSSHEYYHTKKELSLWVNNIAPGSIMVYHDVSIYAKTFDHGGSGGVQKALLESHQDNMILINQDIEPNITPTVYLDGCGLGIIQKQ